MGTANRSGFDNVLEANIKKFFHETLKQWDKEYTRIYDVENSNSEFERYQELGGFSHIPASGEGVDLTYGTPFQGYQKIIGDIIYKYGFKVTRELKDDQKYSVTERFAQMLANSVRDTVERIAYSVINNGHDANYANSGIDQQPLFSTTHSYGNGKAYSNKLATSADFSLTSYEALLIQVHAMEDAGGLKKRIEVKSLNVSPTFGNTAKIALGSSQEPTTANNAVNPYKDSVKLNVSHYATDPDAWFLRTDEYGLIFQDRVSPEFKQDNDYKTEELLNRVYMRFGVDWFNPQVVFGSEGG